MSRSNRPQTFDRTIESWTYCFLTTRHNTKTLAPKQQWLGRRGTTNIYDSSVAAFVEIIVGFGEIAVVAQ